MAVEYRSFAEKATLVTGIMDRIAEVAAGYRHTLVLTERGSVYGMGSNRRSELAFGNSQKSVAPVKINSLDQFVVTKIRAGSFSAALT